MFSRINQSLRTWAEKDGRGYPDWATRYRPVVAGLRKRGKLDGCILEIGANANGLARFAKRPVIAIDLAVDHLHEARENQPVKGVAGYITQLPFPDNSFDACVCMDTFEHIPQDLREYAALEILRVLKGSGTAVIAFPSGEESAKAEAEIRRAYNDYSGGGHIRWLDEHVAHTLPDAGAISAYFRQGGQDCFHVFTQGNTNLRLWIWMWRVLMCGWPGHGNGIAQAVLRLCTPILSKCHTGTCYRAMIWIDAKLWRDE